jgi:hypothetical protein
VLLFVAEHKCRHGPDELDLGEKASHQLAALRVVVQIRAHALLVVNPNSKLQTFKD